MEKRILRTSYLWVALLMLTACTNDEPMDDNALPESKYPLEIASVTMSVESSSEPWGADAPQTRVAENADGMSSVWEWNDTERIGVQLYADGDDNVATYTLNADKTLTSDKTLYWKNKEQTTVTAWYPVETEVSLANQKDKLAYVLKGSGTGTYRDKVSLSFSHALAKVRVLLNGSQAENVKNVQIKSYTSCTNTQGSISTDGANEDWITMKPCTYNGTKCWEANVVPNHSITKFLINEKNEGTLNGNGITPLAAKVNTITINVKSVVPEDAKEIMGNISDNSNYVVRGTRMRAINITGGSPHIYLDGANINVSDGPAINITGDNPTIHVFGGSNTVSSDKGAGIYVAEGCTVTIQGSSRKDDVLKATAGRDGAGIGCSGDYDTGTFSCGNIVIKNVTVYAYSDAYITSSPGIGSRESCGTITIDNVTVYARGTAQANSGCPAIGSYSSVPTITINGSDIYAYRGAFINGTSYADYIGRGGITDWYQGGQIQGDIKSTTVYKYKWTGVEVSEGVVVYGADGISKEQVQ